MLTPGFRQFFIDNYAYSVRLAASLVRNEEVARDIVQDAFLYLYRSEKALEPADMRNYLYMVVRNKCADYYRKASIHSRYADYVQQSAETMETADEHDAKIDRIYALLEDLSPKTRRIILDHYLNGMKYSELADEMDISESAVKKHLVKGLKYLRKNINQSELLWCPFLLSIRLLLGEALL